MDAIDENEDPRLLRSRETDDATSDRRKRLLGAIEEKFNEYGSFFAKDQDRIAI